MDFERNGQQEIEIARQGDLLGAVVQLYRHSREEVTSREMLEADVAHLEKFESPTLRSEDVSLYL